MRVVFYWCSTGHSVGAELLRLLVLARQEAQHDREAAGLDHLGAHLRPTGGEVQKQVHRLHVPSETILTLCI